MDSNANGVETYWLNMVAMVKNVLPTGEFLVEIFFPRCIYTYHIYLLLICTDFKLLFEIKFKKILQKDRNVRTVATSKSHYLDISVCR